MGGRTRSLLLGSALALGAAPVSGQVPEWTLERGVTIGSVDDPVYGLSEVGGILADAERAFVLLRQDATVRVFSRAGEFIRDLGRRGEGPGEFTRPNQIGWHGSRLWINESMSPRLTFFDVATGEAETIRYGADVPGSLHRWMPSAVLADGRVVASPQLATGPGGAMGASELPIIVTEPDGTLRDTLTLQSIDGLVGRITAGRSVGETLVTSPIPDLDLIAFAPDGSSVVVVKRRAGTGARPPRNSRSRNSAFSATPCTGDASNTSPAPCQRTTSMTGSLITWKVQTSAIGEPTPAPCANSTNNAATFPP